MSIPPGFCQCGCGQRTKRVAQDDPKCGYKKGDYRRFVNGHHIANMQPGYIKKPLHPKICVICGKEFLPQKAWRQQTQMTCSAKCRQAYNARKSKEKRTEKLRARGQGKSYLKADRRHIHRTVMEKNLGRPLRPGEVVHHKDGNHLNNAPENLEVMTQTEHLTLHARTYWRERREVASDAVSS